MKEEIEVKKSERSSKYPGISLESAIKVVGDARRFGRETSDVNIAGKGIPKGGGFIRKRAALGYFGLLEGRGSQLKISDLSESILFPENEKEKLQAIRTAFLTPEIFSILYNEAQKNVPIDLDVLGNILIRKYGITPSAKNDFITVFIKSGIFAHLIEYNADNKNQIVFHKNSENNDNEDGSALITYPPEPIHGENNIATANISTSNIQVVELSLEKGGKVKIVISGELTRNDVKKLTAQVKILGNYFDDDNDAG